MVYGSVMGSFTVERFGVERLTKVKRSEITARARLLEAHFFQALASVSFAATLSNPARKSDWQGVPCCTI